MLSFPRAWEGQHTLGVPLSAYRLLFSEELWCYQTVLPTHQGQTQHTLAWETLEVLVHMQTWKHGVRQPSWVSQSMVRDNCLYSVNHIYC